ncbi:MAG TPA: ABC transporter ATP-binding protein [Gemmataceae bacterium]|jgi:lipopolysaccharide transport system ATP-binding protein
MKPAIRVHNLSKRYNLGSPVGGYKTLRESIMAIGTAALPHLVSQRRTQGDRQLACQRLLWALKDVSLDIQPGEAVGVIGRNGAGKSTFLKVLSRITEPTDGRVELYGRVGSLLEVGTGFHAELTGRENIYLNGAIFGMTRREIDRKFDDIVAFSEVEQFLDTPVKRYSSGMFVRLAFAVAAHLEPEILLVDEVLAVGDVAFQKKCLGKMGEVSRSGRTVLFVSHNMATILNLCDKAAVFAHGRLAFVGPVEEGVKLYMSQQDAPEQAEVDLADHPNRRPSCTPVLGRIRLLDGERNPTTQIPCGAPMMVELAALPHCPFTEPHFAVGIDDVLGCRILTAATYLTDTAPPSLRRTGPLMCRLDGLPLVPGRYALTLNAGPQGAQWTDMIDQALWFEVVPTDYYGNGQLPSPDWGRCLIRSRWSRVKDNEDNQKFPAGRS